MKVLKAKFPAAITYIVIFFTLSIAMANLGGVEDKFKDTKVGFSVIDYDNTDASYAIKDYLSKTNEYVEIENDKDVILDAIYYSRTNYVLIIKEGYEEKLLNGETDGLFENYKSPDSTSGVFIDEKIDEYVKVVSSLILSGESLENALNKSNELLESEIKVSLETFAKNETGDFSKKFATYFQYMPYALISMLITVICPVLLSMNRKEIRDRSNCSCIKFSSQTLQIILACFVFAIALWLIFVIAGIFMNGGNFGQKHLLAVLNSFVFMLISLAIALIASNLVKNENTVGMISNVVGLGMCFLCGIFVPQNLLGEGVVKVSKVLPAYWYIRANNMLSGSGDDKYSVSKFLEFVGIEMIFALCMFAIAVLISRKKKQAQ